MKDFYSLTEFDSKGNIAIHNGTLLVPSLTGQSRYGYHTDFSNRAKLIHAVIAANVLSRFTEARMYANENSQISFFLPDGPPAVDDLLYHYSQMLTDLNNDFSHLKMIAARDLILSLKLYVHYGPVVEYNCGNYSKIFGETVSEVYELANNSIGCHSFAMLTDSFLTACSEPCTDGRGGVQATNICHVYGEARHIGFVYYDYTT